LSIIQIFFIKDFSIKNLILINYEARTRTWVSDTAQTRTRDTAKSKKKDTGTR